jgi:5-methyltetrahydropteroyltriglutamate--homocysteine methyltransferase
MKIGTMAIRTEARPAGTSLPAHLTPPLPPIPTHVIGSHGFPGWFWTALDKIKAGDYSPADVRDTFDAATPLAIRDQERAGVDVICDGGMRRFFFVQTFYGRMDGLEPVEPLTRAEELHR